jgi:hypothetical protein
MKKYLLTVFFVLPYIILLGQTAVWTKHELLFESSKVYDNPIYDVNDFRITFTTPSGREKVVRGFWDGANIWKVRFMPDETGLWSWFSECSDEDNAGLHEQSGNFNCVPNSYDKAIFQKGAVGHQPGQYYLSHDDGTPFFWLACTAWNGALKSTREEWNYYLDHRVKNNYSVIQLVTTEWRGCDKNPEGLSAIEGTGYIRIHPEFFERIDKRIDEANAKGLLVSPVILWALPRGEGRHLSPGYNLPLDEAVLLARYIVARYQGNHVIWTLGGDGQYYDDQEVKWKEIGRRVFNDIDHAPVTLHPHGSSWVGDIYDREEWYSIMGYQSSHSNSKRVVDWINKGPMSQMWSNLKPMPYINMEPNYEEIHFRITAKDVRNACYWSIFATPVAGVTYGANGIWPWLAPGEKILNHRDKGGVTGWRKSLDFSGSMQMGYLAEFIKQFKWWNLYPANDLLSDQPGEKIYNHWISVLRSPDYDIIIAYIPEKSDIKLFNHRDYEYSAQWFDPVTNEYSLTEISHADKSIHFNHDFKNDMLIVLRRK